MVKRSSNLLFLACITPFIVLLLVASAAGQTSSPELPQAFVGTVFINDTPADQGLVVEAVGPGVLSGISGNPVRTMAGGVYGTTIGISSQKLIVQGDIEPGTPVVFFVGGLPAEVYPVAAGGPWRENYSYIPGEITELNLRIASQPSVEQTREPTPVQTRLPPEAVSEFTGTLPQPGVVETIQPGAESTGAQPAVQPTTAGVTPVETSSPAAESTTANIPSIPSESPSQPAGSSPLLLFGGIVVVIIILAGIIYEMKRRRPEEKKDVEKAEEKTEVKEKE